MTSIKDDLVRYAVDRGWTEFPSWVADLALQRHDCRIEIDFRPTGRIKQVYVSLRPAPAASLGGRQLLGGADAVKKYLREAGL